MVFEILYSSSQICSWMRWNLFCTFVWIISFYYALKWTLGIGSFVFILILISVSYACYVHFNGYVSLRKIRGRKDVRAHKKAVLITGCDTGFGFEIAKRLSEKGFQVFACCLFPFQNGGKELSASPNIHILGMDVSKEEDITLALDFVKHHLGINDLWAVINNAGISKGFKLENTPMESVEKVICVNLLGTIRVTKAFLPLIRKSKGRIINIASAGGRFVMPGLLPYSVSKNAVIWFSDGLRLEMAKFGVSVVTIEPWAYKTRLAKVSNLANDENLSNNDKKITSTTIKRFASVLNYNIDEVINAMEDAVTCHCPPYVYRPGKLYLNVLLWVLCLLPKPVSDYALCYFIFKSG